MSPLRAVLWTAVSTKAQAEDEKASLPAQEADLRALAERQGWQVSDVMRVPGHSRRYIDWHELVNDSLEADIDAFFRLQQHLEKRDFDVLVVRDADRFARTQTLHAYIVESVIDRGAIIWSLSDGRIDKQNFRMFIAMSGYKAAAAVDQLVKYREMAMNARPEQGLPSGGRCLWSHKIIRNELGKTIAFVVDESKRRLFEDIADLLLLGVSWVNVPDELVKLGHEHHDWTVYYSALFHPTWWGHSARKLRARGAMDWVLDPEYPVPEGVIVRRNVYPPVWTGERAEAVRSELLRRRAVRNGRHNSWNSRRFGGLMVCAACGSPVTSFNGKRWLGLTCSNGRRNKCVGGHNTISERKVVAFLTPILKELKASGNPDAVFGTERVEDKQSALDAAIAERDKIRSQARAMARLFAENAGTSLESIYASELRSLEARATAIGKTIAKAEASLSLSAPRRQTLEDLDVENFWKQTDTVINQTLHRIFGQWRIVLDGGIITGYTKAKRQARKKPYLDGGFSVSANPWAAPRGIEVNHATYHRCC